MHHASMDLSFNKVLLVGDVHGNGGWWWDRVVPLAKELEVDAIVQLGNFGWWPHTASFTRFVARSGVPTWFLDGNHENHIDLRKSVGLTTVSHTPLPVYDGLGYLPRGSRFTVGTLKVGCVGGAHSIDKAQRRQGRTVFDEETLSKEEVSHCRELGHVDVLLCHDAPAGWAIPGLPARGDLPAAWRRELPHCEKHRQKLADIYTKLTPSLVVHGHYHSFYTHTQHEPWGDVHIVGLGAESPARSFAVLEDGSGTPRVSFVQNSVRDT